MIKTNENQFQIGMMCRILSVSRSGYYQWKLRPISARNRANQLLANDIKRVDIINIWTEEVWLYLAVELELYSRRVISWAITESMTASLVCDALMMALWRRRMPKGVIVHSYRGSQYCSAAYQKLFCTHQLICSMSKKGDCYDNAAMESCLVKFNLD